MVHQFDFLVLGSGIAGLSFALKVAPYGSVAIVTKKQSADSNTNWAQGGIAAVMDPLDSFEKHIEDTLIAGAGLCKREAVEVVVKEGPGYVRELMEMGARFTQKKWFAGFRARRRPFHEPYCTCRRHDWTRN